MSQASLLALVETMKDEDVRIEAAIVGMVSRAVAAWRTADNDQHDFCE
ncbi:MAG: hypothetical protein ACREUR_07740 [Nitrosospira sp.]